MTRPRSPRDGQRWGRDPEISPRPLLLPARSGRDPAVPRGSPLQISVSGKGKKTKQAVEEATLRTKEVPWDSRSCALWGADEAAPRDGDHLQPRWGPEARHRSHQLTGTGCRQGQPDAGPPSMLNPPRCRHGHSTSPQQRWAVPKSTRGTAPRGDSSWGTRGQTQPSKTLQSSSPARGPVPRPKSWRAPRHPERAPRGALVPTQGKH